MFNFPQFCHILIKISFFITVFVLNLTCGRIEIDIISLFFCYKNIISSGVPHTLLFNTVSICSPRIFIKIFKEPEDLELFKDFVFIDPNCFASLYFDAL